jgi:hypothetical protein
MIEFPITSEALLTLFGAVIVAIIAGLWLKRYLPDWRYTPLVVLACTELVLLLVLFATTGWRPGSEQLVSVALMALFGASLETFGYEAVVNALGLAGFGHRSDMAQLERARERVLQADIRDARNSWLK